MHYSKSKVRLLLLSAGLAIISGCRSSHDHFGFVSTEEPVGRVGKNRYYTPANQLLTPAGFQVELPGLRPQALALSPDKKLLVTSGKTAELIVINPGTGAIVQRVALPSEKDLDPTPDAVSANILEPDEKGQVSFTGLVFSPDGSRLYLANVNGSIKVFTVDKEHKITSSFTIPLPEANAVGRKAEIPSGLAVSADGKKLYVVMNLSNRLGEFDASSGKLLRSWDVGVAPYDVVLVRNKAYVSNWGGRRPDTNSVVGPAGRVRLFASIPFVISPMKAP